MQNTPAETKALENKFTMPLKAFLVLFSLVLVLLG